MNFRRPTKPAAATGTCFGPAGSATARIERAGDRVRVVSCTTSAEEPEGGTPRGVAFAELVGVLHRLDLPPADAATTPKLIAAQLETLIPGQAEHVRWGWQRTGDGHPVLVYTAARRRLDALLEKAALAPPPAAVTAPGPALHQVFSACTATEHRDHLLVVGWDRERLHLLRYRRGQLDSLETVGLPEVSQPNETDAMQAASLARQQLDESQPQDGDKPRCFVLLTHDEPSSEALSGFERALGCPARRADGLLRVDGLEQTTLPNVIAIGAALAAADPGDAIDLSDNQRSDHAGAGDHPSRGRWIAAAALMLAALVLLYVSDTRKADRLEQAVEDAGVEARDLSSLNTDLAVARYLEKSGPGFLAILDELSHRTEGFMVDELRFEREGLFTMQATGQSAQQINQLVEKLTEMKTLTSVRVRNQAAGGNDKITYTLVAVPSPRFFAPFAPPELPANNPSDTQNKAGGGS